MKNSGRFHTLLLLLTISVSSISAQDAGVAIYGTVRDMVSRDSIPFPTVSYQELGTDLPPTPVVTTARGRYSVLLTEQKAYLIRFGAPGKVGKCVELDLRGPSEELWEAGYGMNIDPTVMDSLPDVYYSVLLEPFGKAFYNADNENYEWDVEYTSSMRERQAALMKAYRERSGIQRKEE
jgi:hypothetical protein